MQTLRHEQIFQNDLILQSIAEGILVVDKAEQIVFANFSAAKNLAYTTTELIEKNYHETLFKRGKNEELFCPVKFALTEGETSHVNTETFFRSDGSDFLVEYICVPLIENAEIIGAVITFEDITERRDIQTAIAQARDAALENVRARAAFLANMSHEIRTPLNGIIGTTDLLLNSELNREQKNYAEMLKTSGDLLLKIVNEILDFSKIEAGKLELETIEFDVRRIVHETANLFSAPAKRKNLALEFEIDAQIPPTLLGDSSHLRQVLNNLLSNSIKFTETGEIRVKISLKEQDSETITLLFEVFDSGIGVEKDVQKHLFEPFAQADISTTRKFGGTGLGLAICRRIVELMNGEIGLESRAGFGSKFWFTAIFLRNTKSSQSQKIPITVFAEIPNPTSQIPHLKVLVVEDNPVNLEITEAMLRQNGIIAKTAENGFKAVKLCRNNFFDLVLMDCRMPEMDGFEASRKILEQATAHKKPKIVALTASVTAEEREQCFAAGMSDFLTKPITKNVLNEFLSNFQFDSNHLQNLDSEEKLVQHSLSEVLAPETLKTFTEIEAGGEENFVREMLELFCGHTENEFLELEKAFMEKNIALIKQKAHSLKGSSFNIGAIKLPELFEKLEAQVTQENWTKIGEIISEAIEIFKVIKNTIEKNYENG